MIDHARVPTRRLASGTELHRIHQARYGPWFFDRSPGGRFNPTGRSGRGTCYWATRPLGALVESFRTVMTWSANDIALRALSTIVLEEELLVADLTLRSALAAGVTLATSSGADYKEPQALADVLQGVVGGVRYRARHDLSARLIAVAWFGDEGGATGAALAALPPARTALIPDRLIRAARAFGYRVLPPPSP